MRTNDIIRLKSLLARLEAQRARIRNNPSADNVGGTHITASHDADFYTILLRRVYRKINKLGEEITNIKNIRDENKSFLEKIWIRDHFDHVEADNWEVIKELGPSKVGHLEAYKNSIVPMIANVTIVASVIEDKIISGPYEWDLEKDHAQLNKIVEDTVLILEAEPDVPTRIDWKYAQ
jgi:hypothetical protein